MPTYSYWIKKGTAILVFAVPFLLLALPSDYFDTGQSRCLSIVLFEQECPACGLTRALMHLIHFNFAAAYKLNKMSLVIFPLIVYLWWKLGRKLWQSAKISSHE